MVAAGLATSDGDGTIALIGPGPGAACGRSCATSAQVTGPMLATVDRADLDTTIRTLEEITRRARETNTTEGNR